MKISTLFSLGKLKPSWQISADNTLWRLMFSHNGLIVGEDRNIENKSVTFFCVDAKNGQYLWKEKQFSEQWWIGAEGISENKLFLHGFQKPDMPEHKGIICVDLLTGIEQWRNNNSALCAVESPFVYGSRDLFARTVFDELDETTGVFIRELEELPSNVNTNITLEKNDFRFAEQSYSKDESVEMYVAQVFPIERNRIKCTESIHLEEYVVFNIHAVNPIPDENGQETLTNTLYVFNSRTGKKIFSDILNQHTPYPAPDSFFVDRSTLYCIKERKIFMAIELRKNS